MENGNVAMQTALEMLQDGRLSLDENGCIWRNAAFRHGKWVRINPRRAENVGGKGYLRLTLQIDSKLHSVQAHRVIWTHLVGEIPDGMQINHKDLNKQNNRIGNLEVVTPKGNTEHSIANGRTKPWAYGGDGTWRGKPLLSDEQKQHIRHLRAEGVFLKDIAEEVGVSVTHVHRICQRKE